MQLSLVGITLGPYELVELAGQGGMATVYKAYQANLERWVAVKVLHTHDPDLLARFDREAKAVAKLHHPNILPVYEYAVQDDWPYIVMQFVEQGTLANYLTGQPLDPIQVVRLIIPIAEALHYAHQQGLIHRDIKPSNILMAREDWPLLVDFGLVKVKNPDELFTQSDLTLGTPAYISPEQVSGQKIDARADMYSLGVMMFELATGRLPFDYKNLNLLMLAHVSQPPPNPGDINPGCPAQLQQIILTTLRKSPDDRYADMQALANALRTYADDSSMTLSLPVSKKAGATPASPTTQPPSPAADKTHLTHRESLANKSAAQIFIRDQNIRIDLLEPRSRKHDLVIGRLRGNIRVDIDLSPYGALEAGVSRQHARLIKQEDSWLLDDLGSTNGTYVNDTKLTPGMSAQLNHGDEVRFGVMNCVFLRITEDQPDSFG